MYSSKCFNLNYIEIFGYETRDKLIWTSGKSLRNTDTTRAQGITRSNMNKTYPFSSLGFVCSPNKDTNDILSKYFFFKQIANLFFKTNREI